jgi:hypothetical protein
MRRLPWILLVAVIGLAVVLLRHVSGNVGMGAAELLASAREEVAAEGGAAQTGLVLRKLGTALDLARANDDRELTEAILVERAKLLRARGAYPASRQDYEALLALEPKDPIPYRAALLELDVASGNWERAIETSTEFLAERSNDWRALTVLGRACDEGADEKFEEVDGRLRAVLTEAAYERASILVAQVLNLPVGSPEQVRAYDDLISVFTDDGVLLPGGFDEQLTAIAELHARARAAHAASAGMGFNSYAAASLVKSLLRARLFEQAAFMAEYALEQRAYVASNVEFVRLALDLMLSTGRVTEAGAFAERWYIDRGTGYIDMFTYKELGRALYAGQRWETLLLLGQQYHDLAPRGPFVRQHRDAASFYVGMASWELGDTETCERYLSNLRAPEAVLSIPGGFTTAFKILAQLARESGRTSDELALLLWMCQRDPVAAGDSWLRAADLQDRLEGDVEAALATLTSGIRAHPERAAEWFVRWREMAQVAFDRRGRDIGVIAADVADGRIAPNDLLITQSDTVLLIEHLLETGRASTARYMAILISTQLSNFAPLVEIQMRACRAVGRLDEARDHAVQLLAWGYASDEVDSFLRREWSRGEISAERVHDVIRGASTELATLFFLSGLLEQGEPERALAELARWRRAHPDARGSALVELGARALLDLGRPAEAWDELLTLEPDSGAYANAVELHAQALMGAPTQERFDIFRDRLAAIESLDVLRRVTLARVLLTGGRPAWSLELLEGLRSTEIAINADLYDVRALAAMALGRTSGGFELLERSRAFGDEEHVTLLELLFTAGTGDDEARAAVAGAVELRSRPALERCAIAILRDDPILMRALLPTKPPARADRLMWSALARIADPTTDPLPELALEPVVAAEFERAFGGPITEREPQYRFAAAILAAGSDQLTPWLGFTLGRLDAREGLWQGYFAWRLARVRASEDRALRAGLDLVGSFPGLEDVWFEMANAARRRPTAPAVLASLESWFLRPVATFPDPANPPSLVRIARALALASTGRAPEAAEEALAASGPEVDHPLVQLAAARLARGVERHVPARERYARALATTPESGAPAVLAEYLGYLDELVGSGVIDAREQSDTIVALGSLYPTDQALAAHRALSVVSLWRASSIAAGLTEQREGLVAIRSELEALLTDRLQRSGQPLERGAAEVWAKALALLDPDRGADLMASELRRGPMRVDLWIHHLDLLEAAARFDEADELSARLSSTLAAPRVTQWRARFVMRHRAADGGAEEARALLELAPPGYSGNAETRLRLALLDGDEAEARRWVTELWSAQATTPEAARTAELVARVLLTLDVAEDRRVAQDVIQAGLASRASLVETSLLELLAPLAGLSR